MVERMPVLDNRKADDVVKQLNRLLNIYLPEWNQHNNDRLGEALIAVFGRYAEIIIERLNQVPKKNFLAFLDLLGASPLPPQSARVPLTFNLAEGAVTNALVPKGTQVAAEPAPDEQEPVLFETDQDLIVSPTTLSVVGVREPAKDLYTRVLLTNETPGGYLGDDFKIFAGKNPCEHILYLGQHELSGLPNLKSLTCNFTLKAGGNNMQPLVWEYYNGKEWQTITPNDTTNNLQKTGTILFTFNETFAETMVGNTKNRWLRCQFEPRDKNTKGLINDIKLSEIENITMTALVAGESLLDAAYSNNLPLETGQEFFPFGEKPKQGDSFYLAHREAFSQVGAQVQLKMMVIDPNKYTSNQRGENLPILALTYWHGQGWKDLTVTSIKIDNKDQVIKDFNFTAPGQHNISFTIPKDAQATTLNGLNNVWLRVQITQGNYGQEASISLKIGTDGKPEKKDNDYIYNQQSATLVPPLLGAVQLSYQYTTPTEVPDSVLTYNGLNYQNHLDENKKITLFQPFLLNKNDKSAFYFGFKLADGLALSQTPLSLYIELAQQTVELGYTMSAAAEKKSPQLLWQYWNGKRWLMALIQDGTKQLQQSGLVMWLPAHDITTEADFGQPAHYWLRAQLASGGYPLMPIIRRVLLHTTMATQAITLINEVLGSSNENKHQQFRTTHAPIIPGQRLQVQEAEMPTAEEVAKIYQEEGQDAIKQAEANSGRRAVWVRWHEVNDFYASGPRDRHYVLDRSTGMVCFGDGINGLIPQRGVGNIRLAWYQTGGGQAGNKPIGAVSQLQTSLPYIDGVTNFVAAAGGADAESEASLLERLPKNLRHHQRAVTAEDFEDLALLASPKVARALCIPLLNVAEKPYGYKERQIINVGHVSIIIVPNSDAVKPLPDLALITHVQKYLSQHAIATATITVAPPLYLKVDVAMTVAWKTLDTVSVAERQLRQKLEVFLHPLTGGFDGKGWAFGTKPYQSDIYRLAADIPDIDHVSALDIKVEKIEDLYTRGFLIYSGQHTIQHDQRHMTV